MLTSLIGFVVPMLLFAQQKERPYRKFNTQSVLKQQKKDNPDYEKRIVEWEDKISKIKVDTSQNVQIPIVFHIFDVSGIEIPDLEQVKSQLDAINTAFGIYEVPILEDYPNEVVKQFYTQGVSVGINFCIPEKIENIAGINYIKSDINEWKDISAIKNPEKGGFAPVLPKNIINVWVGNFGEGSTGYATFPTADENEDGIIISYDFFGIKKGNTETPYNQGKTLVHLLGNYLGLKDLWNEYEYCADDGVGDTPVHNAPNHGVITIKNHKHISMCNDNFEAMYMNFMDNSDDSLQTMFTSGQKKRIWATLSQEGPRSELGSTKITCKSFNTFTTSKEIRYNENKLIIYPNPASQEVIVDMISTENGNGTITIINSFGAIIQQQNYVMQKGMQKLTLNCSNINNGFYFVKVQFADKSFITKNLSIQN
jgi:Secretion system C-terminal sorting domain/Pregnancy-associated plasma protein-A